MSKPIDPQIIHDALVNYIQKTRVLYQDKAPFVFFNHPNIHYTEEEKIAVAWRQGMYDALGLIARQFLYQPTITDNPSVSGQWMIAVPENLKEAAEKIITPHPVTVVGERAPNIELPDDDWSYDEMRDNELQDKLANE